VTPGAPKLVSASRAPEWQTFFPPKSFLSLGDGVPTLQCQPYFESSNFSLALPAQVPTAPAAERNRPTLTGNSCRRGRQGAESAAITDAIVCRVYGEKRTQLLPGASRKACEHSISTVGSKLPRVAANRGALPERESYVRSAARRVWRQPQLDFAVQRTTRAM
jgi:hypothetical protein